MTGTRVGVVEALFRYPVKSMQGEPLGVAHLGPGGVAGDRRFAVRERDGRVLTAKRTRELLGWSAAYGDEPSPGDRAPEVVAPDGDRFEATDERAAVEVSRRLGREVVLEAIGVSETLAGELDADTIFGDIPIAEALAGKPRRLSPDADRYDLAPGTFFDSAHLHVLTTGTLDHLRTLIGEDADTDVRRFRPNVLVRTDPEAIGFVEDGWIGHRLRIGDEVELASIWPTLRCVMTTVAQGDVPRDLRVLRTIARRHETNLGAFAAVAESGSVRLGDPVVLAP